jgi:hypothetical protein
MADPGTLKRIDEPPGEETKGSRERSPRRTRHRTTLRRAGLAPPPDAPRLAAGIGGPTCSRWGPVRQGRWTLPGQGRGPWPASPCCRTLANVNTTRPSPRGASSPSWWSTARRVGPLALLALLLLLLAGCAADAGASASDRSEEVAAATADAGTVVVRYFYGAECPYCQLQGVEMDAWEREYDVEIHRYEVWHDAGNRALFQELAAAYGEEASGVPMTFIGERIWIGFDESAARQMRAAIVACEGAACLDPLSVLDPGDPSRPTSRRSVRPRNRRPRPNSRSRGRRRRRTPGTPTSPRTRRRSPCRSRARSTPTRWGCCPPPR